MNQINSSKINFNLLKALNALLQQAHVTKAADELDIGQSAMSHALYQLRNIFEDELLVRAQSGALSLTPKAKELKLQVQKILNDIDLFFAKEEDFIPKKSEKIFHIGMSDYVSVVLLAKLTQSISKIAPKIKIVVHHLNFINQSKIFESGEVDLAIGSFDFAPKSLMSQKLFEDQAVCMADQNHPIFTRKEIIIDDFLRYPQVMVSFEGAAEENFIEKILRQQKYQANIKLVVPHALSAIFALPQTSFITTTVDRISALMANPLGLNSFPPPFKIRKYIAKQYWHQQMQQDKAHQWLRQLVKSISDDL